MSQAVSAVILDYGGVLFPEDAGEFDALGARHGLAPGRLWAAHHDIPEYALSRCGRIDRATYVAAVARELARDVGSQRASAVLEELQRERAREVAITPEMEALLPRLKGRIRLGLLSNAMAGSTARLAAKGVAAHFDDVICSGDVGLMKPDPEVYRLAASRLGVDPVACAYADDLEKHVVAARSVGMRAHHYTRSEHGDFVAFLVRVGALPGGC